MSVRTAESLLPAEYPKIETLFDRDPANMKRVVVGKLRDSAFGLVDKWLVTEKIDGTNVRVTLTGEGDVRFGGRTDNAQMPMPLLTYLTEAFPADLLTAAFDEGVTATLYGEGYGPKVQSGGWYRADMRFRLFDVRVGDWWLNWKDVEDVATKLGILTVPVIGRNVSTSTAITLVRSGSHVALEEGGDRTRAQEGVVCRTDPLLLMRNGKRLIWKLKGRDLA